MRTIKQSLVWLWRDPDHAVVGSVPSASEDQHPINQWPSTSETHLIQSEAAEPAWPWLFVCKWLSWEVKLASASLPSSAHPQHFHSRSACVCPPQPTETNAVLWLVLLSLTFPVLLGKSLATCNHGRFGWSGLKYLPDVLSVIFFGNNYSFRQICCVSFWVQRVFQDVAQNHIEYQYRYLRYQLSPGVSHIQFLQLKQNVLGHMGHPKMLFLLSFNVSSIFLQTSIYKIDSSHTLSSKVNLVQPLWKLCLFHRGNWVVFINIMGV